MEQEEQYIGFEDPNEKLEEQHIGIEKQIVERVEGDGGGEENEVD